MNDLSPYLDGLGYPICINNPDGGDCAADMGTILALTDGKLLDCQPLPWGSNQPLRYWKISSWAGQPNKFSRDQLIAVLCGFTNATNREDQIDGLFRAHKKRLFLTAWNTVNDDDSAKSFPASLGDICGPEVWALWLRLKRPFWAPPVLWLLDIQTLVGAIQWRFWPPNQLTRNHMLVCINMREHLPSITTLLINWINDWPKLVDLWKQSNEATTEFPTWQMFKNKLELK